MWISDWSIITDNRSKVRAEDAVNDFGVPEKSKYSTATKPVLLK